MKSVYCAIRTGSLNTAVRAWSLKVYGAHPNVSSQSHKYAPFRLTQHINSFGVFSFTPCSRVLLEKLIGFQLVKKFPTFYGTRRFVIVLTSARHLSGSWTSSIQSLPPFYFLKIHLNIILPPRPGSSQWSLSLRFPHPNSIYTAPFPPTSHIPGPSPSFLQCYMFRSMSSVIGRSVQNLKNQDKILLII